MASDNGIEERIGRLLWYGVAASGALAIAGMTVYLAVPPSSPHYNLGDTMILAGVAVLLLTPAARVAMLFIHYVHLKDHDFVLITLIVLAMMVLGYASGYG